MNEIKRIDELLALLVERPLTESEQDELQELLRSSPEALDRYIDHCEIETWLAAAGDTIKTPDFTEISATRKLNAEARSGSGGRLQLIVGVAAAILLMAGVAYFVSNPKTEDPSPDFSGPVKNKRESVKEMGLAASDPSGGDPWKVINSTGSVKHPGMTESAVPKNGNHSERPVKFNRDIRPILSETCFHCHGPDEHGRRAELRLDTSDGALADLGGYQAIKPGDLKNSEAWGRILSDDPDELMPPPESHLVLTDDQKLTIKRWIEQGAEYEGHWAYQAPGNPPVPGKSSDWGKNEFDAFIFERLAEEGMKPSDEADPRTLIRRLSFDLTGLPPGKEVVEAFLKDYSDLGEKAWQDVITRLLDSPHFGERMAVPWMDQSRYADTNGYSIDGGRHMWLWRDWVIQAYNRNLPFDQFAIEQLAGDLLPDASESQKVATGFNRNHMITHEGGTIPEENLTNYAVDRVKTTSEVFLGLTMACAQCHDHKFDPISQKEYYEFFSFFNELSDKGNDGNAGINAGPKIDARTSIPDTEVEELRKELAIVKAEFSSTTAGFPQWLSKVKQREIDRGRDFKIQTMEVLDVSSPNRPGPFEAKPDGSVVLTKPSGGTNAFSHAYRISGDDSVDGIRIRFYPSGEKEKVLTPHPDGVPKVATVLVSAGDQPAKQVDIYRQLRFDHVTAESSAEGHPPHGIIDETSVDWWQPVDRNKETRLTLTFDKPVDPAKTPYLTVMVFYGVSGSLPSHWKIEGFSGIDTDSVFDDAVATILSRVEGEWSEKDRETVLTKFRNTAPELEGVRIRIANLEERVKILTEPHSTMVMNVSPKPRVTFRLDRGQYDAKLEKVSSDTPKVLPPMPAEGKVNRLDLARWMVQSDHPLTARVAVNRIWSIFFGTGIVASSADFGSQGEWPSHPELLDWMANDFVAKGWDQKALIRKIVSSAAYRQDSSATGEQRERDPKNRLLGRGPRFRLPAEFIRDQVLATSGLLVPRIGGPSVQPYQPPGLWKEVSHFGSSPATKQVFVQDKGEKLYRRSLYTIMKRTSPHPGMSAFDAPNREMCIVQRGVTNTPLQALVTLNDPQFAEASRVFAARLIHETPEMKDRDRLRYAFEEVTGRPPQESEMNALASLLGDELERFRTDLSASEKLITVGDSPPDEALDSADQAAWTQISTLLFNLSETLTRL